MSEPLDEVYLKWLYGQFASPRLRNPCETHWKLARVMFTTEFVWLIPNDDNRVEDGWNLRQEFLDHRGLAADSDWLSLGCSFLEMVVALTRRLAFEAKRTPYWWFWRLMKNLDLERFNDALTGPEQEVEIQDCIHAVIWRTYEPSGKGGLFPLEMPAHDQRKVEIWYQLNTWLLDNEFV